MTVKIVRMNKLAEGKVKAFVDIDFCGLVVKGFKVVEGNEGLFVGYPDVKDKTDKYRKTVFPSDVNVRQEIEKTILDCYNK